MMFGRKKKDAARDAAKESEETVEEQPAQIIGSGSQHVACGTEAKLRPGGLDIVDMTGQFQAGDRMNGTGVGVIGHPVDTWDCYRVINRDDGHRDEFGESAGVLLQVDQRI